MVGLLGKSRKTKPKKERVRRCSNPDCNGGEVAVRVNGKIQGQKTRCPKCGGPPPR